jgi:protein TonB
MEQAIGRQPTPDPIAYTLLLAAAAHVLLILGLGFSIESRKPEPQAREDLKVVLLRPREKPPEKVDDAELLAQVNQTGSGDGQPVRPADIPDPQSVQRESSAPPPAPLQASPEAVPPPASSSPEEPAATTTPDAASSAEAATPTPAPQPQRVTEKPAKPKPKPKPRPAKSEPAPPVEKKRISAAQLLASRSTEIARLTSELERKSAAFAKLPRRKAISASTTEYKYAAYMEAWRRKVENIGNLNYPEEARRKKLYGNLLLHVAVRADGSVERIRLLKSSGHKLLDDAAINIVRMAAPYAPFPKDIRKEVDVLDITRTWQFLSSNRLGWK